MSASPATVDITAKLHENQDFTQEQLADAGLRFFFNLANRWGLNTEQQITLLGQPGRTTFFKWKKGEGRPPKDTLERVSHLLALYKSLVILFQKEEEREAFIKNVNSSPCFTNMSPLELMLEGKMIDLLKVRQYLDVQRGG